MKPRQAFTLIEVMVVLSILAIIAVLAYNFFGSTMREARLTQQATKTYNDLRIIGEAYDQTVLSTGTSPTGNGDIDGSTSLNWKDLAGKTKAVPLPEAGVSTNGYYWWLAAYDDFWADGTNDAAVSLYYVSDALCQEYNRRYTDLGAVVFDYQGAGSTYPATGTTWGLKWNTADVDQCEIIWVLENKK